MVCVGLLSLFALVLMVLFSDDCIAGMDIMGLLTSVRVCHQVPPNMDLYHLGVQE